MIDTYLKKMENEKVKYIREHKDEASFNLKKYFNPEWFKESDFEVFAPKASISSVSVIKEIVEERISCRNESYGVNWCLCDTYSEMRKLKGSGNAFLVYIADFCSLAADILIEGKEYGYSKAFFCNARSAELVLFLQLQDIFDVQVTLLIITEFWLEYVRLNMENEYGKENKSDE